MKTTTTTTEKSYAPFWGCDVTIVAPMSDNVPHRCPYNAPQWGVHGHLWMASAPDCVVRGAEARFEILYFADEDAKPVSRGHVAVAQDEPAPATLKVAFCRVCEAAGLGGHACGQADSHHLAAGLAPAFVMVPRDTRYD